MIIKLKAILSKPDFKANPILAISKLIKNLDEWFLSKLKIISSLVRKWGKLTSFSVIDQAIVSLANFLFNIYLANTLKSEGYGSFAIGFAVFLFFSGFHNALLLEPMVVIGPIKYKNNIEAYVRKLINFHFLVSGCLSILGCSIALILLKFSPIIAQGILGASISTPFILLFWLSRRACYLSSNPQKALRGSAVYAFSLAGILVFRLLFPLSIISAFIWMGISSLIASISLLHDLYSREKLAEIQSLSLHGIWPHHWKYGKWVIGSALVYWLGYSITVPAVGIILGLAGSGVFRAMQNLIMPLQQIGTALGALFLPWFSEQITRLKPLEIDNKANMIILGFFSSGFIYFVFLLFTKEWLIKLFYREPGYSQYSWLIVLLGIFGIFDLATQGLSILLRANQKPEAIFRSQVGGAITSVTLNLFLIWKFGLVGAGYGMIITSGVVMVLSFIEYKKHSTTIFKNTVQ